MGSGNIYADIGVEGTKGMLAKAQLAFKIDEFIRSRKLSKTKAARIMDISQSQLAELLKGRFRETSIAQIKAYLKRLEIDEDPLAEDLSGYIGKLKWRKANFKFSPNDGTQKQSESLSRGKAGPSKT
jgi:predicted XRE-type DNA-binding protein